MLIKAGPGASPVNPQPSPKQADPKTNFELTAVVILISFAILAGPPLIMKWNEKKLMIMAESRIKRSVESQLANTVKKFKTLEILQRPEIMSPDPNITPQV